MYHVMENQSKSTNSSEKNQKRKRIIRLIFRIWMGLFYLALFIGGIVTFVFTRDYILETRLKYDFIGIILPVWEIAIILSIISFGFGGYG
jgi:hypothetical protein